MVEKLFLMFRVINCWLFCLVGMLAEFGLWEGDGFVSDFTFRWAECSGCRSGNAVRLLEGNCLEVELKLADMCDETRRRGAKD